MRILLTIAVFTVLSACVMQVTESREAESSDRSVSANARQNPTTAKNQPVLVELFTSEGCSSCPPAERLLAELQEEQPIERAEIISMALHVDYWDDLGWKDKYASPLFTQRQRVYDRKFRTGEIYTPQMIVDGDAEFVGSNREKAEEAITKAIKRKKAEVDISLLENTLEISISRIPDHEQATIYLAYTEDNLSSDVKRGENAGKNLKHLSLVRRLKAIDKIDADQYSSTVKTPIQLDSEWNRENTSILIFLQENSSRKIIGVNKTKLVN